MGAQHSTSRLNRLSHGGNMPRAPKCGGKTQTQQVQGERAAQLLLSRGKVDSLRMNFHRAESVLAPLTPLPRRPAAGAIDDDLDLDFPLDAHDPSALLAGLASDALNACPGLEEGEVFRNPEPVGMQLDDMPLDVLCRILAHLPRSSWPAARAVSTLWRDAVGTPEALWQRSDAGLKDPWAVVVEWVFGNPRDKRGILWAYDPSADQGEEGGHMYRLGWVPHMEGINHTSQMVAFGPYAIFLGGTVSVDKPDGSQEVVPGSAAWSYHLVTGRLRQMPEMLQGRVNFACAVVNGKLIVAGGTGAGDEALNSAEEFDPKTCQWVRLPDLTVSRGKCFGGERSGRLFVFSQNAEEAPEKYAEVYDPAAKTWALDKRMSPSNFSGKSANRFTVVGNKVVLTSDLGPNNGCGSLEHQRSNLSMGNQLSWCTSVM